MSGLVVYASTESGKILASRYSAEGLPLPQRKPPDIVAAPVRALLALHPKQNVLYAATGFDISKDGYSYDAFMAGHAEPNRKKTDICVFAIQPDGRLLLRQSLSVRGVLAGLMVHPSGQLLYGIGSGGGSEGEVGQGARYVGGGSTTPDPGGLPYFHIAPDGRLNPIGRTAGLFTFGLMETSGDRVAWALDFTADGHYAYSFSGTGFIDHSENYLQKFRVAQNGRFAASGPIIQQTGESKSSDAKIDPGWVTVVANGKLAVIRCFDNNLHLYHVQSNGGLSPHRNLKVPQLPVRDNGEVQLVDPLGNYFIVNSQVNVLANYVYAVTVGGGAVLRDRFGGSGNLAIAPQGGVVFEIKGDWKQGGFRTAPTFNGSRIASFAVTPAGTVRDRMPSQPLTNEIVSNVVAANLK